MNDQPLFASTNLADGLQNLQASARLTVDQMPESTVVDGDMEALVSSVAGELAISVPRLGADSQIETRPCSRTRQVEDYGRHITVTESCVEVYLPFTGDRNGFFMQPSQRSLNLP